MTRATLLFLPPGADRPWRWLRVENDAVAARGEGLPDGADAVIAVAPADAVTLHWADLPARSPAQAAAAARVVVADAVAVPLGELHVAVGAADGADRAIAVVAVDRMRGWLDMLARLGIDPAAILPAPLLLPRPADGYVRADVEGQPVVRGTASAFADEARLTALVTGDAVPETLSRDALDGAIAASAARLPLDLRQGAFARHRRRAIDWSLVRRLAAMAGLILLATLAIDIVRIARYDLGADTIEAEADALARQGLPRGADQGDPSRLLDERLSRLRGPGQGFSRTAAAVLDAIRATPGTEASAIDFQPNGDLRVTIGAAGEGEANALRERLIAAGFAVNASPFESTGGRLRGDLTVVRR